jgi:hypothetical protein
MPNRLTQMKTLGKKVGPWLTIGVGIDALTMTAAATNPVVDAFAGAAVIATLVIPVIFATSQDRKWKKQMKKADKVLAMQERYQGYNQECVNNLALMAGCHVNRVVSVLQACQMATYDGARFTLRGEDLEAILQYLRENPE